MKKKLFTLLIKTLKDNLTKDELQELENKLQAGELSTIFPDAVKVAKLSAEADELASQIDMG